MDWMIDLTSHKASQVLAVLEETAQQSRFAKKELGL